VSLRVSHVAGANVRRLIEPEFNVVSGSGVISDFAYNTSVKQLLKNYYLPFYSPFRKNSKLLDEVTSARTQSVCVLPEAYHLGDMVLVLQVEL